MAIRPWGHGWGLGATGRGRHSTGVQSASARHHHHPVHSRGYLHSQLALLSVQHEIECSRASLWDLAQHDALAHPLHVIDLTVSSCLH